MTWVKNIIFTVVARQQLLWCGKIFIEMAGGVDECSASASTKTKSILEKSVPCHGSSALEPAKIPKLIMLL